MASFWARKQPHTCAEIVDIIEDREQGVTVSAALATVRPPMSPRGTVDVARYGTVIDECLRRTSHGDWRLEQLFDVLSAAPPPALWLTKARTEHLEVALGRRFVSSRELQLLVASVGHHTDLVDVIAPHTVALTRDHANLEFFDNLFSHLSEEGIHAFATAFAKGAESQPTPAELFAQLRVLEALPKEVRAIAGAPFPHWIQRGLGGDATEFLFDAAHLAKLDLDLGSDLWKRVTPRSLQTLIDCDPKSLALALAPSSQPRTVKLSPEQLAVLAAPEHAETWFLVPEGERVAARLVQHELQRDGDAPTPVTDVLRRELTIGTHGDDAVPTKKALRVLETAGPKIEERGLTILKALTRGNEEVRVAATPTIAKLTAADWNDSDLEVASALVDAFMELDQSTIEHRVGAVLNVLTSDPERLAGLALRIGTFEPVRSQAFAWVARHAPDDVINQIAQAWTTPSTPAATRSGISR